MIKLPIIQIAGVFDLSEARMIAGCGATHLGFPLRLPVNRPDTSEQEARDIIAGLPPAIEPVVITYISDAGEIAAFCQELGCRAVQLHGSISVRELSRLRRSAPSLTVFKSLVVGATDIQSLERICAESAEYVDAFITDTYDPHTGASGATGLKHDWDISKRLVERSIKPVILAGGLNPENVATGIKTTGAAGVDAHTGLEREDGRKDPDRVAQFVQRAGEAFAVARGCSDWGTRAAGC